MTLRKDFVLLDWVQFADFLKFLAVHSLSSICEKISLCEKVLKHLSYRMTEFVWVKSVFFGILEFSLFCPFFQTKKDSKELMTTILEILKHSLKCNWILNSVLLLEIVWIRKDTLKSKIFTLRFLLVNYYSYNREYAYLGSKT